MENIIKHIDAELWEAISKSPFNSIDYEDLLATNPTEIRTAEKAISLQEEPLAIAEELQVENIYIPTADKSRNIRLRIYRPKGKQGLPVLLFFHGEAFIYGTPEQYDVTCCSLALAVDLVIVSVDYRLAPEHPFPAAMEDGYTALVWLAKHAAKIAGNKDHILIAGSSAGATIAASITQLARDRKEVIIRHQYLLYPPMSHLMQTASMTALAHAPMQQKKAAGWMWKHYLQDQLGEPPAYAVPLLTQDFYKLPPASIIVCELDPLKDEGIAYAQALQEANVAVDLLEIKGAVHAFDFFDCGLTTNFYAEQIKSFKKILSQNK